MRFVALGLLMAVTCSTPAWAEPKAPKPENLALSIACLEKVAKEIEDRYSLEYSHRAEKCIWDFPVPREKPKEGSPQFERYLESQRQYREDVSNAVRQYNNDVKFYGWVYNKYPH